MGHTRKRTDTFLSKTVNLYISFPFFFQGNFVCATQVDPGTGVALEIGECDMTACPLD